MIRRDLLLGFSACAGLRGGQRDSQVARSTAFTNATVIAGTGTVLRNHTVLVEGEQIVAVHASDGAVTAQQTDAIDCRGMFIVPGLCDAHAHLSYFKASALPVLLANGVTSVRDMGGLLHELDRWQTETNTGVRAGPRIFRAGPILNGKQFNEFQVALADAAEGRGAVRGLHNAGVDFIKVHAAISRTAYEGIRDECKQLNLPYAGHMPRAITPEESSDAGQLTLEHVGAFGDRLAAQGVATDEIAAELAKFRQQQAPALFERFAKNKTWFTPTLVATKSAIHLGDHQPDPRAKYVSASCKKITTELLQRPSYREFLQPASVARQQRAFDQLIPMVALMHEKGVELLAGSDFAVSIIYPGFSLHEELELLVMAGLSPAEALRTATVHPARVLGQKQLGTVEAGQLADFLLLTADPLADIRNTRKIETVVCRGRTYGRGELNRLLEQAAAEAAVS